MKNRNESRALPVLTALLLAAAGLTALAGTAGAHACEATDDEGCNAHSCPEGEDHHHVARHWWRTHYCVSGAYCVNNVNLAPPAEADAFAPILPAVPTPFETVEAPSTYECSGGSFYGELPI